MRAFSIENSLRLISLDAFKSSESIFIMLRRPFQLIGISLIVAWIYTLIPIVDFWSYSFVRQQFLGLFTTSAYVEKLEACLPDISDEIYLLSYCGYFLQPLIAIGAYLTGEFDVLNFRTFAFSASVLWSALMYGIHVFLHPTPSKADRAYEEYENHLAINRETFVTCEAAALSNPSMSSVEVSLENLQTTNVFYDMFEAVFVREKDSFQEQDQDIAFPKIDRDSTMSWARFNWLQSKQFRSSSIITTTPTQLTPQQPSPSQSDGFSTA
jgi:hypothetical protein